MHEQENLQYLGTCTKFTRTYYFYCFPGALTLRYLAFFFFMQTERSVDMLLHGKKPLVEVIVSAYVSELGSGFVSGGMNRQCSDIYSTYISSLFFV
jgi:hypothetical protein